MFERADLHQLQVPKFLDVERLIYLFKKFPDQLRASKVRKDLRRDGESALQKLRGKANRFAKRYLLDATGDYWAGFSYDENEPDPLITLVWKHASQSRVTCSKSPPVNAPGEVESDGVSELPAVACSTETTPRVQAVAGTAPDLRLFQGVLHHYRPEEPDEWGEAVDGALDPQELVDELWKNGGSGAHRAVFVRCLAVSSWSELAAEQLAGAMNSIAATEWAKPFVGRGDSSDPRIPMTVAASTFCAQRGPRAAIIAVPGYWPVHEWVELRRSLGKANPQATLIVFGYATSTEMRSLSEFRTLQVAPPRGAMAKRARPLPASERAARPTPRCGRSLHPFAGE